MRKQQLSRFLESLLLFAITLLPGRAMAEQTITPYTQVETIAAHGSTTLTNWFTLVGVSSASTCPTSSASSQSRVLFTVPHDELGKQQIAMVTAALLAGRSVQVTYDPTVLLGGYCQAIAVFIK